MEKNILTEGVITRWLRIVGKTKHKKSCMRAEVFGVKRNPGYKSVKAYLYVILLRVNNEKCPHLNTGRLGQKLGCIMTITCGHFS